MRRIGHIPMKAHTNIIRDVEKASFFVWKSALTWVRLTFSSLRFRAAAASVCGPSPRGSHACRCATVTAVMSVTFMRAPEEKRLTIGGLSIPPCHFMNNPHGILISTLAHKKFWRLVYREADESEEELDHTDPTHYNDEIPPTHVLRPSTDGTLLASKVAQQGPGNKCSNHLSDGPIDRQDRQKELMRTWKELKEDCRVYRQVSANAKAPKSCKTANGSKVGRTGSDESENASNTEREVEGPFAAENVSSESPKHCPEEQSDVLSKS